MNEPNVGPAETAARLCDELMAAVVDDELHRIADGVLAEDAVIWSSDTGVEQDVTGNLKRLRWITRNIAGRRYDNVRRASTPTGLVQQHVVRGTAPNGAELSIPACFVVEVRGERIVRIDEYFDSASIAALGA